MFFDQRNEGQSKYYTELKKQCNIFQIAAEKIRQPNRVIEYLLYLKSTIYLMFTEMEDAKYYL